MTKEILLYKPKPIHANNCLIESACAAVEQTWSYRLNHKWLNNVLPYTNGYAIRALTKLLTENGFDQANYNIIGIPHTKNKFRLSIIAALRGGAICETGVNAGDWLYDIRQHYDEKFPKNSEHSILIFGYYQPIETNTLTWFYVYDSFDCQTVFISADQLFQSLQKIDPIPIGLYGLCQDVDNLQEKYTIPETKIDFSMREHILESLPKGRSAKNKLRFLLKD